MRMSCVCLQWLLVSLCCVYCSDRRFILNGQLEISDMQLSLCCPRFVWILQFWKLSNGNQQGHWNPDKRPMGTTQLRHCGLTTARGFSWAACGGRGWDLQSRFHLGSPVFRVLWDAVERMGRSRPASFRCPVGVPDVGSSIYPWFRPAPLKITVICIVKTVGYTLRKQHTHTLR